MKIDNIEQVVEFTPKMQEELARKLAEAKTKKEASTQDTLPSHSTDELPTISAMDTVVHKPSKNP